MDDLLTMLQPYLLEAVAAVVAAAVAYATMLLRRWTGAEMDAKAREALHSALMTGVMGALRVETDPERVAVLAARYAAEMGAPGAVKHFGLQQRSLEDMARSKLPPGGPA